MSAESTQGVGPRLHPGLVASVVFVILSAMAAAALIIKKYCFPVNQATYRYSSLQQLEGQGSAAAREENDRGPHAPGEETDEELLD